MPSLTYPVSTWLTEGVQAMNALLDGQYTVPQVLAIFDQLWNHR